MGKKLLLGLVAVVIVLLVVIQTRPGTFHVERSTVIAAPAEAVHATLNDFHTFPEWSPWQHLDPNMKVTIEGEPGVGQKYHWAGNSKAGEGEMRITESVPGSRVGMDLDFIKPFASKNRANFDLAPEAGGTKVTWSMDGNMDFVSKAMSLAMPMDKMIGPDFEKGLAALSRVAVAAAPAAADGGAMADTSAAH